MVRASGLVRDTFRGFPFKGIGNSRAKVQFRLVKAHQIYKKTLYEQGFFVIHYMPQNIVKYVVFVEKAGKISRKKG